MPEITDATTNKLVRIPPNVHLMANGSDCAGMLVARGAVGPDGAEECEILPSPGDVPTDYNGRPNIKRFERGELDALLDFEGPMQVLDLSDTETAPPPPPKFWIDPVLPESSLTLLTGHGGTGKSMLALIWAALLACGETCAGMPARKARVLFVSLEDDGRVVKRRLHGVLRDYGLSLADVLPGLDVLDATDAGPLMAEVSEYGNRRLEPTEAMLQLQRIACRYDVVVLDNASDALDANENERRAVRAFVRALVALVKPHGGAVLLLAHLPKDAAKSGRGESYSGSTAWHNSARSRLAMMADDGGVRVEHQKSNHGRLAAPQYFSWSERGVLMPSLRPIPAQEPTISDQDILAAIGAAAFSGAHVPSATSGPHTGAKALMAHLAGEFAPKIINAALARLEARGQIRREFITTEARHRREVWVICANAPMCANAI